MNEQEQRSPARFSTGLRGYNPAEVDRYVALLTEQIDELEQERAQLLEELERLRAGGAPAPAMAPRDRPDDFEERLAALDAVLAFVASHVLRTGGLVDVPDAPVSPEPPTPPAEVVEPESEVTNDIIEPDAGDDLDRLLRAAAESLDAPYSERAEAPTSHEPEDLFANLEPGRTRDEDDVRRGTWERPDPPDADSPTR